MALKRAKSSGGSNAGLLIASRGPSPNTGLGMQCHRYDIDDFDGPENKLQQKVKHGGELESRSETDFCVGIDSWGNKPLAEHMIPADKPFDFAFFLRPFTD